MTTRECPICTRELCFRDDMWTHKDRNDMLHCMEMSETAANLIGDWNDMMKEVTTALGGKFRF